MRLVACHACRTQYDVDGATVARFACPCGAEVETAARTAVDAAIRRCGACGAGVEPDARACAYCGSAITRDTGPGALVCPECYARNRAASRFCTGCGVAFQPQPMPRAGEPLPCPACESDLALRVLAGTLLHQCPACDGLWVRNEGFDALVARTETERRASTAGDAATPPAPRPLDTTVVYRRCPSCRQRMVRKNFGRTSGVIVDWCGRHGLWLDADELEHVARFVAAGGLERGRPAQSPRDAPLDPATSLLALEQVLADRGRARPGRSRDLIEFLWTMFETS